MWIENVAEARRPDFFREIRRSQRDLNRLFGNLGLGLRPEFPAVQLWAGSDGAIIYAEVPGVPPDQIDVTVYHDTVTLRGKSEPENFGEDATIHRQERAHGPFSRTVVLPFRVDADKVVARFARGVLTLELPRPASDRPRQVKIARE
jgi:HSP20 family protein